MPSKAERRSAALARYRRVIARFPRVKVLVAGDLMLDQFIWGKVDRISPEAPVPVVLVTSESFHLGGAANVVRNVRSLGGRAIACGVIGDDSAGRLVREKLKQLGASMDGVACARNHATIQKTRIIAHQQQVVRLDREDEAHGNSAGAKRAREFLLSHVGDADVVVVSDYGKGFINPELLSALADARRRRPFRLVIDPKQPNFPHYRAASLVTPNQKEASFAAGIEIRSEADLAQVGAELLRRWNAEAVLITRGEQGMSLLRPGVPPRHFATVARHVFDVTGAGDTVVATCALALGAGADLETAAMLANHAAGIVVGEVGTATVTTSELQADLER